MLTLITGASHPSLFGIPDLPTTVLLFFNLYVLSHELPSVDTYSIAHDVNYVTPVTTLPLCTTSDLLREYLVLSRDFYYSLHLMPRWGMFIVAHGSGNVKGYFLGRATRELEKNSFY